MNDQLTKMDNDATKAQKIRDEENQLYKGEQSNFDDTIEAVDEVDTGLKDSKSALSQISKKGIKWFSWHSA